MFKSIGMISDETFSDFQRVPNDLTFAQGVELLKTQQEKLAHNHCRKCPKRKRLRSS